MLANRSLALTSKPNHACTQKPSAAHDHLITTFSSRPAITDGLWLLRCPETLFISHENANFPFFSVFRVVQGETKTPKIMGCCRANFALLHALKIGTFRGKWTLEWVFKTSLFVWLALYFLINSKLAFSLIVYQRYRAGTAKRRSI